MALSEVSQEELDRIQAELEAAHEATERAAVERGDPELPEPPQGDEEPPLPEEPAAIEPAAGPAPADEPHEPAADQAGEAAELTDDELALLFEFEGNGAFAEPVEDDDDYDPSTTKPAAFR